LLTAAVCSVWPVNGQPAPVPFLHVGARAAGVRDGGLHDARHTAATVLLLLGVPEQAVMGVMGWSNTAMAARYQHVTATIQRDTATRVGGRIWQPREDERD
jgi:integrase